MCIPSKFMCRYRTFIVNFRTVLTSPWTTRMIYIYRQKAAICHSLWGKMFHLLTLNLCKKVFCLTRINKAFDIKTMRYFLSVQNLNIWLMFCKLIIHNILIFILFSVTYNIREMVTRPLQFGGYSTWGWTENLEHDCLKLALLFLRDTPWLQHNRWILASYI